MFGRVSFILYLLNLIGPSKARRWFLYGVIIQHVIVNLLTIILIVAQCPNFATMWDPVRSSEKGRTNVYTPELTLLGGTSGKMLEPIGAGRLRVFSRSNKYGYRYDFDDYACFYHLEPSNRKEVENRTFIFAWAQRFVSQPRYSPFLRRVLLTSASACIGEIIRTKMTSQIADRLDFTCTPPCPPIKHIY
jgi:hypothetical protein